MVVSGSISEPLFVDPYAGCFLPPDAEKCMEKYADHYCIATKFIDDKLLSAVNNTDGLKQVFFFPISGHGLLD